MHLECINGNYYASLKVPAELRAILNRTTFRQSLKTKDKLAVRSLQSIHK